MFAAFEGAPDAIGRRAVQVTAPWVSEAERLLSEGYGAEDIAVKLNINTDDVRKLVGLLRLSGALQELYRGRK